MKRILIVLVVMVIGASASGCAGKKHYLQADGGSGNRHYPATTTTTVPRYEDPAVTVARGIARQTAIDRARWKVACLELRSNDPYATYADCRKVFGDDRKIGYGSGYGREVFRIQRR